MRAAGPTAGVSRGDRREMDTGRKGGDEEGGRGRRGTSCRPGGEALRAHLLSSSSTMGLSSLRER